MMGHLRDEKLLNEFRRKQHCERCQRRTNPAHPHHLIRKNMGGGGQIDVECNLVALCVECHDMVHFGVIMFLEIMDIVATRMGHTVDEIAAEHVRLRRLPKDARREEYQWMGGAVDGDNNRPEREAHALPAEVPPEPSAGGVSSLENDEVGGWTSF